MMGKISSATDRGLDAYTIAGWLAMIAVPIAPAFYFGFGTGVDAYQAAEPLLGGWAAVIGILVGVVGAVGLELVGILAGHTAVRFFSQEDYGEAAIAAAILLSYVLLGISGLESWLQRGVVMFLIAPLAYLLVALHTRIAEDNQKEDVATRFEQEQVALDKALERKLKLQRQQDNTAVRLAKAEAGKRQVVRVDAPVTNGHLPGDFRLLNEQQKEQVAVLTTSELEQVADISASTARRWKRKVSANGHYAD
jgi:hypothetical protein